MVIYLIRIEETPVRFRHGPLAKTREPLVIDSARDLKIMHTIPARSTIKPIVGLTANLTNSVVC